MSRRSRKLVRIGPLYHWLVDHHQVVLKMTISTHEREECITLDACVVGDVTVNETRVYERIDVGCKCFRTTQKGGPLWKQVYRRVTEDMDTGERLADEVVDDRKYDWHQPLPSKMTSGAEERRTIKTQLFYVVPTMPDMAVSHDSDKSAEQVEHRGTEIISGRKTGCVGDLCRNCRSEQCLQESTIAGGSSIGFEHRV